MRERFLSTHITIALTLALAILTVGAYAQAQEQRASAVNTREGFEFGPQEQAAQDIIANREQNDRLECVSETGQTESNDGSGGDYVPVHETGELLSLTEGINRKTVHANDLLVDICMHLKAVRRVQYQIEAQVLYHDPNARKAAAKAIFEHKQTFIEENIKKGYEVSPGLLNVQGAAGGVAGSSENKQPLYVSNIDEHLQNVRDEAYGIFDADLSNSQNPNIFSEGIRRDLALQRAAGDSDQARVQTTLGSTMTRDEFNAFTSDFSQGGWDAWLKLIDPRNNYPGSRLLAQDELALRESRAEGNAREEISSAKGFLPVRECANENWVTTTDGKKYCRKWVVKTPASINQSYLSDIVGSTLRQNELADQSIEDFSKDEFARVESELTNIEKIGKTQDTVAVQSVFQKEEDPCPGPGPCVDSGWTREGDIFSGGNLPPGERGTGLPNLGSLAQQLYNNRNLPGALALLPPELRNILNQQGSQEEIIRQVTEWLNGDANGDGVKDYLTVPPSVAFTANTTPMELARADRNTTKLSWTALNASKCTAINDWLSADKIIKARNANIQTSGTLTIEHPYTFPVTITRSPDIPNWASGKVVSAADEKLISQRTIIDFSGFLNTWAGDYTLTVGSATLTTTDWRKVSFTSFNKPEDLVRALLEAYTRSVENVLDPNRILLQRYDFNFDINAKKITITAKPVYKLLCENQKGEVMMDVTATR